MRGLQHCVSLGGNISKPGWYSAVGRIMLPPQNFHILFPGTHEYVTLHGKEELSLQIELRFANQLTLKINLDEPLHLV